ncbi:RsmD family RNA methyltransferase [Candidatus Sneabacter namystus]|uniref:Methyltransferase domain-containing protein n=1 Tax=Candidatus Sneabacter namystus TaxID=2601646 RepID=A0A5C0UJ98_9RICK|nr:RsmD family RNA methyltransferase [Candidatus Sneabacter namystus]QEK39583.1 methyltransferase domain-containing protein [Candidatus Sneabacter namystus]
MKILKGYLKNKSLPYVKGHLYRPMTSVIREAIFNTMEHNSELHFYNANILDLFAGSGSFAFEALSRGAKHATLIDLNVKCVKYGKIFIKENCINASFIQLNALALPKARLVYDIVFLDPPYHASNAIKAAITSLIRNNWINESSIIVCKTDLKEQNYPSLNEIKSTILRKTKITFYKLC